MSCKTDRCLQGRMPCPTPWACERIQPAEAASEFVHRDDDLETCFSKLEAAHRRFIIAIVALFALAMLVFPVVLVL